MSNTVIQVQCHSKDFSAIEATLRKYEEVEAVGSFREKKNNSKDLTNVFVTCHDEEKAAALQKKIFDIDGVIKEKEQTEGEKEKHKASKSKKNLAAEFLMYESFEEKSRREREEQNAQNRNTNQGPEQQERKRDGRGGRGGRRGGRQRNQNNNHNNNNNNNNSNGENNNRHHNGNQNNGRNGRMNNNRGNRQHYRERPPLVEANVAFVDNVPFGTTNNHLMEVFSKYGRVLDLTRLELMVMVCYDNPESVQLCIQNVNGTKINGNTVTVSSGTVLVPLKAVNMMSA